jgi:nitrite reductase (NO-forming)
MTGRLASGGGTSLVAAGGAASYVAGMALAGFAAARSIRGSSGQRRVVTEVAYGVGLVDVLIGVSIVALYLAGDPTTAAAWTALRVAHAWLNLLGFVALVIAGTLVHFAPTVAGSRIRRRRAGSVAVGLLGIGAPAVAAGYAIGSADLARLGALAAIGGGVALTIHGVQARRDRAGWTSDLEWHRFTSGSLLAAPTWLVVATAIAAAGIFIDGIGTESWRLELVVGPLVLGFVVQVLLGSVSHLVPAIGRGSPEAHAIERRSLGRAATWRLVGWNVGVGMFTAGQLGVAAGIGTSALVMLAGGALALVWGLATLALVVLALRG